MLQSAGHDVVVYRRSNTEIKKRTLRTAAQVVWNWQAHRELSALISEQKPDIAHFHNTFPIISPAAYYAARAQGVPVVQTLHNFRLLCPKAVLLRDGKICEQCVGKSFAWKSIQHRCYQGSLPASFATAGMLAAHWRLGTWRNCVTRYIALTEFAREKLVSGGFPRDRIAVKPNCVRPDPGLGSNDGDYAIFVGRLAEEKGLDVLIEAWRKKAGRLTLLVVGDGPLKQLVTDAQADGCNVRWLGYLEHAKTLELIQGAKVLVFPSVLHEGFGRSIIESFAAGAVVVTSNLEPMNQIVTDGETGLLFDNRNSEDLAGAVCRVIEDDALRSRLRAAGRREFEQRYTAERNLVELTGIYESAIRATEAGSEFPDNSFHLLDEEGGPHESQSSRKCRRAGVQRREIPSAEFGVFVGPDV